ncbi:5729_t:CDS:2, partial [Gigaspora margarita]
PKMCEIIEYHDILSIFNLLPNFLLTSVLKTLGKRIIRELDDIPNIKDFQIFSVIMNEKMEMDENIFSSCVSYDDHERPIIIINCNCTPKSVLVRRTFSPGISATTHVGVKRLLSLFEIHKSEIDRILKSKHVYAIGLDFQLDCLIPCIVYWADKPLKKSIAEELSGLFNSEFEILYRKVTPVNTFMNDSNESGDNYNSGNGEKNKNCKKEKREEENNKDDDRESNEGGGYYNNDESNSKDYDDINDTEDEEIGNKEGKRDRKENNDKNGKDNEGGDGGDDDNDKGEEKRKYLHVDSTVIAKPDPDLNYSNLNKSCIIDPKVKQIFSINVRIWANVEKLNNDKDFILKFEIDLYNCGMSKMLSNMWPELRKIGFGYFLDSIEIHISPISDKSNDRPLFYPKCSYKQKLECNEDTVELVDNREKSKNITVQVNGEVGTVSKIGGHIGVSHGNKNDSSIKLITREWKAERYYDNITGAHWSYQHMVENNHKRAFEPGEHFGEWVFSEMRGFRITITQVLRCEIQLFHKNSTNFLNRKKPVILNICPKMAHVLEISFENIQGFNKKFAALENQSDDKGLIVHIGNKNLDRKQNPLASSELNIVRCIENYDTR